MASPESQVAGYRPDVDGLRAVAILVVVLFHAFPTVLPGGFVGVDIFFVISGYLISSIILKGLRSGSFDFSDFYARRARRIFPALIVVLLFALAAGWFTLIPTEYAQLGKHVAGGALFVQNAILFTEAGYFDVASEQKPLMHLWSLAVEEQFYLVYPLLLWFATRSRLGTLTAIVVVATSSFTISVERLAQHPDETFYLSHTRFWELMEGGLLANLALLHPNPLARWLPPGHARTHAVSLLGLALALGGAWGLSRESPFPGALALLPTLGAALLIAAGPTAWVNRRVLASAPMVFIGLISYPLYLWHWPLLSFNSMVTQDSPWTTRAGLVVAATFLAWATRRFVEKPFRFAPGGSRYKVPALVLGLAVTAVGGGGISLAKGVPTRFDKTIRELAAFAPDFKQDARVGTCWLSGKEALDAYAPQCTGTPAGGKGSIVLWGDSHAARLYPGLVQALPGSVRPTQLTRDACPPTTGWGYPRCKEANDWVLQKVIDARAETVVLFANWHASAWRWLPDTPYGQALSETVKRLKQAGVPRVVVLGIAPIWQKSLPRLVHEAWKKDFPAHRVPVRLAGKLVPDLDLLDADLKALVEPHGATFISVQALLCNDEGCLARTSDDPRSLTSWDSEHLTTPGATYLAEKLRPALLVEE